MCTLDASQNMIQNLQECSEVTWQTVSVDSFTGVELLATIALEPFHWKNTFLHYQDLLMVQVIVLNQTKILSATKEDLKVKFSIRRTSLTVLMHL